MSFEIPYSEDRIIAETFVKKMKICGDMNFEKQYGIIYVSVTKNASRIIKKKLHANSVHTKEFKVFTIFYLFS